MTRRALGASRRHVERDALDGACAETLFTPGWNKSSHMPSAILIREANGSIGSNGVSSTGEGRARAVSVVLRELVATPRTPAICFGLENALQRTAASRTAHTPSFIKRLADFRQDFLTFESFSNLS